MHDEFWEGEVADKLAQLGPPLDEFAVDSRRVVWLMLGAVLLFPVGLVLTGLALYSIFDGGHGLGGLAHLLYLGIILLLSAVFLSVRAWRNRGLRVLVFPEGLVRIHGSHAVAVFWDEVETLLQRRNTGTWARLTQGKLVYSLAGVNGKDLQFDDALPDLPRLGGVLQRETLRHLLPRTLDALRAGETVLFGPLKATEEGLVFGPTRVPWDKVKEVKLTDLVVTIKNTDAWLPWFSAPIASIPNLHLLQALPQQLSERRAAPRKEG